MAHILCEKSFLETTYCGILGRPGKNARPEFHPCSSPHLLLRTPLRGRDILTTFPSRRGSCASDRRKKFTEKRREFIEKTP